MQKKIRIVALYNSDWQWALITEFAISERAKGTEVEILDLSGIGCTSLKEAFRTLYTRGKFSSSAHEYLSQFGIAVTRTKFNFLTFLFSRTNLILKDDSIKECIGSSAKDKIGTEKPKSLRKKSIFWKEYCAAIEFQSKIRKIRWKKDDDHFLVNGRFSKPKVLSNFLRMKNIDARLIEFGHSASTLQVFNTSPHNLEEHESEMLKAWNHARPIERVRVAEEYFQTMKNVDPVAGVNWTEHMRVGQLPDDFNVNSRNIVFFTSSNLELFDLFYGEETPEFSNQVVAFRSLLNVYQSQNWKVYIRIHPNREPYKQRKSKSEIWENFRKEKSVILIPADSAVDSFALAKACDLVAHFNSSIGPQLIWEGHNGVVTLGPTFWRTLDPEHHFGDSTKLTRFAEQYERDLEISSHINILPWAYYRATRGKKFLFVNYDSETKRWSTKDNLNSKFDS